MPDANEKEIEKVPSEGARRGGRGFRSQPLALKILLLASLAAVVTGVVRCSLELTQPPVPIRTIAIAPVTVQVPSDLFSAPSDSVARVAARQFARALASETGLDVKVVPPGGEAAGDAVVHLTIGSVRGQAGVACEVTGGEPDRVLTRFALEGPHEMLYATLAIAARRAAGELGLRGGPNAASGRR
jgi:hypothetical protein